MTAAVKLVPSLYGLIDLGNQIRDNLGAAPYSVTLRKVIWSGAEIGRGTPSVSDTVLTPRPLVVLDALKIQKVVGTVGLVEEGDALVDYISKDAATMAQLTDPLDPVTEVGHTEWGYVLTEEASGTERFYRLINIGDRLTHWRIMLRKTTPMTTVEIPA